MINPKVFLSTQSKKRCALFLFIITAFIALLLYKNLKVGTPDSVDSQRRTVTQIESREIKKKLKDPHTNVRNVKPRKGNKDQSITVGHIELDYTHYNGSKDRLVELRGWERSKSLKVEDYLNLTDQNNYVRKPERNVQSRFCSSQVDTLILISSHPKDLDRRTAIRETWGSPSNLLSNRARIVFGLGFSNSRHEDIKIEWEFSVYDDIVQERYVDSFNNLTFKTLSLLKWAKFTCSFTNKTTTKSRGPKFVFKTDDDVFININRLTEITKLLPKAAGLIGSLACDDVPYADWTVKYYMPKYLFPQPTYHGYLKGMGYLVRSTIVPILLENARRIPLIHIDDVYVTTLLARANKIYPYHYDYFAFEGFGSNQKKDFENWVTFHKCFPHDQRRSWEKMKNESWVKKGVITSLPDDLKEPIDC